MLSKGTARKENYRPVSQINMHATILNKLQANGTHQPIKRIVHLIKWDLPLRCKDGWFNITKISVIYHVNNKNHMIT